jgi:hypothetical protein
MPPVLLLLKSERKYCILIIQDAGQVDSLAKSVKAYYNDGDLRSTIGGGVLGYKSAVRQKALEHQKEREQVRKAKGQQ